MIAPKQLLLLAILIFQAYLGQTQSLISKAIWAKTTVKMDGKTDEWEKPLNFYENKTRLMFGLANDSNNLYVCIRCPEESNQIKISRAGLVISFILKNKEKKTVSVAFPLGSGGPMHSDGGMDENGKPNFYFFKNEFLMQNTAMRLTGFVGRNGVVPILDSGGVQAAINWDANNIMEYELKIPIKELFGQEFAQLNLSRELVMEVAINGIEKSKKMDEIMNTPAPPNVPNGSMGVNGSMSGQGMTGGMAAGMPQGAAFSSRNERSWLYDKISFKQKFLLREKP